MVTSRSWLSVSHRGCVLRLGLLSFAFVCWGPGASNAQLFERATVIENARIVTQVGPVIETGSIVIKGGRIVELGPEVKTPFLAKKIDASGKTVTPALIDVWSALGHTGGSDGADPTSRAAHAVAKYAAQTFEDALRNGVTTAYVGIRGGVGTNGIGAVMQIVSGDAGPTAKIIDDDVALCINLGSEQSPISRLKTFQGVRGAFKKAQEYRQSLEDYEEDLKEYLEKLEERRKEKEKEEAAEEGDESEENGEGDADKEPDDKEEKKDDKEEPKPDEPDPKPDEDEPKPKPDDGKVSRFFLSLAAGADDGDNGDNGEKKPDDGDKENGEKKDGDEDEDELEKPAKPKPDRASDVLLRAIDHELPIRVEAHRSADMLNALELAAEFKLDLVIEGATDAYLVAERLADADASVVLGRVSRTELFENNAYRRHTMRNAAALTEAGVSWSIGSGADGSASARFVGLNAQLATAYGATTKDWLYLVTAHAADALGLGGKAGRLRRGMSADLVIWSGDPGDPGSRVERVLVGGDVVYDASAGGGS